jgi:hypothetical protein
MSDAPPEQQAAPAFAREGSRVWIAEPLDSPYAIRLRRFGAHWDFDSSRWWVGITKAAALENLLKHPLGTTPADEPEPDRCQQRSAAALLVDMACEEYTLGVTDTGEPYGTHCDTPHVALMLRGGKTGLRAELARRYWDAYSTPAPQQAIADACMVLEGLAAKQDPQRVHLRVAQAGGGVVYIDMADGEGRVIEMSGGEWYIDSTAPGGLFRRTKLTGAMPKPVAGGELSRLWEFVPVDERDRPLVTAWLVQALIAPDVPHPVLVLVAEHGSIKSTSTRCLVMLVDPTSVPLRSAPRDAEGWVTAANASWVVALDNISGEIPLWLSDCLCRAVTGDGDVRRALYTDQDVSVIAFRRAVIINGVDIQVTQGDLADRLLHVDLPRVNGRREEKEVAADWAQAWPHIMGGLLDLAAEVHQRLRSITVADLPRMADYAKVLAAVDEIGGTDGLSRYRERVKKVAADTLDAPFIARLIECNYCCDERTSAEITAALKPADPSWKPPKEWPKNARAVTGQLTRHAPALRSQGWNIEHDDGRNKDGIRRWTITPPERPGEPSPPSPPYPPTHVSDHNLGSSDDTGSPADDGMFPAGGLDEKQAGQPNSVNPPEKYPPTCDDTEAGQTGHDSGPSLVATNECRFCGAELKYSSARSRGHCSSARCLTAARQQTVEGGR